jgi:hypothetical protein
VPEGVSQRELPGSILESIANPWCRLLLDEEQLTHSSVKLVCDKLPTASSDALASHEIGCQEQQEAAQGRRARDA